MKMLDDQFSSYGEVGGEIVEVAGTQRRRRKDAEASTRGHRKKRSYRKRGGPTAVVGMSHRRLHRWA